MGKARSSSKKKGKQSKKEADKSAEQLPDSSKPQQEAAESQPVERQQPKAEKVTKGGGMPGVEGSDPNKSGFVPLVLEKTVIAMPLFKEFDEKREEMKKKEARTGKKQKEPVFSVIIDVNLMYRSGRENAKVDVINLIREILKDEGFKKGADNQGVDLFKTGYSQQYVFADLEESVIKELVRRDIEQAKTRTGNPNRNQAIYHIWPDFEIQRLTTVSVSTVKADAARNAFSAYGEGIIWAVMDSGIDQDHPHFKMHKNLVMPEPPDPLQHRDFTSFSTSEVTIESPDDISKNRLVIGENERPLVDDFGHGTHVAGIIAGELKASKDTKLFAATLHRDENKNVRKEEMEIKTGISGVAPKCKIVSLKVLNERGAGKASNLIAALEWIQDINGNGRRIRIHGVNMSVGYEFEPEWFACGQSPLCVEVDRLVKSGVVVVVAAGNTGYGWVQAQGKKTAVTAGLDLTINDPGNAELAITVGSTHRDMPHIYGVSYFSSKGPTGDGRLKPDLVAPGEKIISCDSAGHRTKDEPEPDESDEASPDDTTTPPATDATATTDATAATEPAAEQVTGYYREESGTSMAAPHVSGVIAAFLSVRREFIGRPEAVKEIFLSTATDLKRERYFQGKGLVDLMRAIQSI